MAEARPIVTTRIEVGAATRKGVRIGMAAIVAVLAFPVVQAMASEVVLPVPRVTIYPGNAIVETMLVERTFSGTDEEARGYAKHADLVGKVARQTLLPNQPVAATAVREPFAVQQGEPAVVVFKSGALVISSTAMPLQGGVPGEVISLRNTDSGTTIRGVVQADGTVRVGGP